MAKLKNKKEQSLRKRQMKRALRAAGIPPFVVIDLSSRGYANDLATSIWHRRIALESQNIASQRARYRLSTGKFKKALAGLSRTLGELRDKARERERRAKEAGDAKN